jgi:hypothetical protein
MYMNHLWRACSGCHKSLSGRQFGSASHAQKLRHLAPSGSGWHLKTAPSAPSCPLKLWRQGAGRLCCFHGFHPCESLHPFTTIWIRYPASVLYQVIQSRKHVSWTGSGIDWIFDGMSIYRIRFPSRPPAARCLLLFDSLLLNYRDRLEKMKSIVRFSTAELSGTRMQPGTVECELNKRRLRKEQREDEKQWAQLQPTRAEREPRSLWQWFLRILQRFRPK